MTRAAHHPQHATRHAILATPRAFTLVELLVVLSLIVLALAAAVPAFNYITSSRSTDSAENMVAAMLQRARSTAIQTATPTGVVFFINPADNRSSMALIQSQAGDDIYSNYHGWNDTSYQQNSAGTSVSLKVTNYALGQEAVALNFSDAKPINVNPNPVLTPAEQYRNMVKTFVHDQSTTQAPPPGGPWITANLTYDLLPDSSIEALPANVGLQTINDPKGLSRDRYLVTGVILFDATGRVVSVPYKFEKGKPLYNLIAKDPVGGPTFIPTSTNSTGADTVYSQLGLVLYDRSAFLNQPGATEGDVVYKNLGIVTNQDLLLLTGPNTGGIEPNEETWLDQNTTPLFVNRGNGTLLKGQ